MVRAWLEARAQMGMLPRGFQPQRQHEMAMMVGQLGSGRAVPAGTTACQEAWKSTRASAPVGSSSRSTTEVGYSQALRPG